MYGMDKSPSVMISVASARKNDSCEMSLKPSSVFTLTGREKEKKTILNDLVILFFLFYELTYKGRKDLVIYCIKIEHFPAQVVKH